MVTRVCFVFSALFSAASSAAGWETSEPVWLLPPIRAEIKETACHLQNIFPETLDLSLNNLAITREKNFLYVAFRTSKHHHPKAPLWAKSKPTAPYRTRLYVLKAAITDDEFAKLPEGLCELSWQVEGEVGDVLNRFLKSIKGSAEEEKRVFGMTVPAKPQPNELTITSVYDEYDLREPLFLSIGGKLRMYFVQIEGRSMKFRPLRTYAYDVEAKSIEPILNPGELMWEIQTHAGKAYASSYSGGHYSTKEEEMTQVHFRVSADGLHWDSVDSTKKFVFEGGANEAAFAFAENGDLFTVMRHEDGGPKGWGGLVGKAAANSLGDWKFPDRVDPKRYDSPRLFFQGDRLFLIARQNVGIQIPQFDPRKNDFATNLNRLVMKADDVGELVDPDTNYPFDLNFSDDEGKADYLKGPEKRETMLKAVAEKKESNKSLSPASMGVFFRYELFYNAKEPKRTALYEVNQQSGEVVKLLTLPSAGDTAFPSLVRLSDSEMLLANYSSPFELKKRSWGTGQENPTGIYFIKLKYR